MQKIIKIVYILMLIITVVSSVLFLKKILVTDVIIVMTLSWITIFLGIAAFVKKEK